VLQGATDRRHNYIATVPRRQQLNDVINSCRPLHDDVSTQTDDVTPPCSHEDQLQVKAATTKSVCLSVCLSARITLKPRDRTSPVLLCMLPVAVARSSSDGIAICYILPVLWMTLCFHTTGPVGQNQASTTLCLEDIARWRYQLDVRHATTVGHFIFEQHQRLTPKFNTKPLIQSLNTAVKLFWD